MPPSEIETRTRLLDAAGQAFAEKGFRGATIRDICRKAGANVAAVNYHFGGKVGLHMEAVQYWSSIADQKYPATRADRAGASAQERLHLFILNFLMRVLDEGRPSWQGRLMAREMAEPTTALNRMVDRYYRPLVVQLDGIVRELIGPGPSADEVRRSTNSILGQCVYYQNSRAAIVRLAPGQRFDPPAITRIAKHIANFSLQALSRMARHGRRKK